MNSLMTSDFLRERFTDPIRRMTGSEVISPHTADVLETALSNKNLEFSNINSGGGTTHNSNIHEDTGNHGDQRSLTEGHSESDLNRPTEERSKDDYSRETSLDKSYEGESPYGKKYNAENSNSSDIESDIDRDELTPHSPRSEVNHRQPIDYYQRLPSNVNFGSGFSSEEARLRLQLKDIGPINPAAFTEAEYRRRLAFSDGKGVGFVPKSSSQPISPESKVLPASAISAYLRLPRSGDELDETLKPNIREGLFFCHLCSFSGTTQAAFDQHMTVHFEHVCPHCDYKSRTEGRLKRHIKDFHTEDPEGGARTMPGRPKVFRCKQCEYSTTDKIEFWAHSRTHIKEDKLLQCPRCPFVTEYKHHLEYHLRNHFGSKPFKCPKCNYACVNKSMLNSHMKSHTNVYQYRCADCTYATKYCHSLKLHLRKYNHKPAAVLNSDGSLPQGLDASASGLSLLSKRGPPRGPRGPRKDKMDESPPGAPHFPMPPAPHMGHLPGLPGMLSPFWPMMPSHLHNGLPSPLGLGPQFSSHLAGMHRFPPGIKKEDITPPSHIPTSSADINPHKCNFCGFIAASREVLTSHVMKVHASDNHDLFSMFGIQSEFLLNDSKSLNAANPLSSPLKLHRMGYYPPTLSPSQGIKREHPDSSSSNSHHEKPAQKDNILSPYSFMNGKYHSSHQGAKDEGIDILKQMTLKFGSGPMEMPRKAPKPASHTGGDGPLDLTKPRYSPPLHHGDGSPITIGQHHQDGTQHDEENQSSGENSVYSNEVTSPTPRKRSRKGKAFKLNRLCMKLQEQQRVPMDSDEESFEMEEYQSEEFLPVDVDDSFHSDNNPEGHQVKDKGQFEVGENSSLTTGGKLYDDGYGREYGKGKDDMKQLFEGKKSAGEPQMGDDHKDMGGVIETDADKEIGVDNFKQIHSSLNLLNESKNDDVDLMRNSCLEQKTECKNFTDNTYDLNIVKKEDMSDDNAGDKPEAPTSPVMNGSRSRRKNIPAAVQRGVDIARKMFHDPTIVSKLIKPESDADEPLGESEQSNAKLQEAETSDNKKDDFECPHCKISFFDCVMYTMHMGYHGYKDPYQCNMCGDSCHDRVAFNLHIARVAHN